MPRNWFKKTVFPYLLVILASTLTAFILRFFIIEAYRVPADVMAPSLVMGDYIFLNKLAYEGWEKNLIPKRGDVVIFSFPQDFHKSYIKRIVAVEGDMIEIQAGQVMVNGKALGLPHAPPAPPQVIVFKEKSLNHEYSVQWSDGKSMESQKMAQTKIPVGHVFVLGDHRSQGQDSRTWGFIPVTYLKGKVSMIWFSLEKSAQGNKIRWSRIMKRVD